MIAFNLRRHVAKETAIGILVNVLVATVPSAIFFDVSAADAFRPVREVAIGLTPQFFMVAFMSGLVPSLIICRKQAKGRLGLSPSMSRLRPERAVIIAAALAAAFTVLVLALIHIVLAPLAEGGLGASAVMALRTAQAAFAGATITPAAILLLFATAEADMPKVPAGFTDLAVDSSSPTAHMRCGTRVS